MRIVLVRHGQPRWVVDERAVGDPELTHTGRLQADRVASRLAYDHYTHLLVSPLLRARETLHPLESLTASAADVLPFLAEIQPPSWDGHPIEAVRAIIDQQKTEPVAQLWNGLPGGEAMTDFHRRITTGWDHWLGSKGTVSRGDGLWDMSHPHDAVLVVAHAGTNASTITHLLGVEPCPWEWQRFWTRHTSVTILEPFEISGAWAYSLNRMNCVEHLPTGLTTS